MKSLKLSLLFENGGINMAETAVQEKMENELIMEKNKDLRGGMDLLELGFILSVIENTKGNDPNDVTMRKLNFDEILRRAKQSQIDSNALAVYAVNAGNLYSKDIQCEATKELAKRTTK
jgi:histone H3/H4